MVVGCQVFSTEFISAMHMDDSEILPGAKEISDPWKQKYNLPIQVTSGAELTKGQPPRYGAVDPVFMMLWAWWVWSSRQLCGNVCHMSIHCHLPLLVRSLLSHIHTTRPDTHT